MGEKSDYTIGLLARLFGVTPGTIRYYEDKNILVSRRTALTSTRRYYARNVKLLFTVRKYLSMGFNVEDVKKLLACETLPEITEMMAVKQGALEDEIARLKENVRALDDSRWQIKRAGELLGKCEMAMRPDILMVVNQVDQQLDERDEVVKSVRRMTERLPLVYPASRVPASAILCPDSPQTRMSGFCVCDETARSLDLGAHCGVFRLPAARCLHTVVLLDFAHMPPMSALFAHCLDFMKRHGLTLSGDAVGRDVIRVGEAQCLRVDAEDAYRPKALYYEYWLPVKKI